MRADGAGDKGLGDGHSGVGGGIYVLPNPPYRSDLVANGSVL